MHMINSIVEWILLDVFYADVLFDVHMSVFNQTKVIFTKVELDEFMDAYAY